MSELAEASRLRLKNSQGTGAAGMSALAFSPNRAFWCVCESIVVILFFAAGTLLSPHELLTRYEHGLGVMCMMFAFFHTLFSLGLGQYERLRRFSYAKILTNGLIAAFLALVSAVTVTYFQYYGGIGRINMLWGALAGVLGVFIFRMSIAAIFYRFPYKFSGVGTSPLMQELVDYYEAPQIKGKTGFEFIDFPQDFRNLDEFEKFMSEKNIKGLVVTRQAFAQSSELRNVVWEVQPLRIKVVDEVRFYEDTFERVPLEYLTPSHFLENDLFGPHALTDFAKRSTDILLGTVGLIMTFPLIVLIAILTKLSSPGPVLFFQKRVGRHGKIFTMYKFRTMHAAQSCPNASNGFTRTNDSRVTWVGKIIRPLHLDELLQLINILKGDMSLVGPRPEAAAFAEKMSKQIPIYKFRYSVRPGLTGHAQLIAGYMLDSVDDTKIKLSYDFYYIKNYSLSMDLRIIVRTAFVVLRKLI